MAPRASDGITFPETVTVPVAVMFAAVMSPEKRPLPCIPRAVDGVDVPIPTNPLLRIVNGVKPVVAFEILNTPAFTPTLY